MSEQEVQIRIAESPGSVNMELPIHVKMEPSDGADEPTVACPRCEKAFYNTTALRNHHKMQHGEDITADELSELQTAAAVPAAPSVSALHTPPRPVALINGLDNTPRRHSEIKIQLPEGNRREAIENILKMEAKKLVSLASEDVSYIIIKTVAEPEAKRRRAVGVAPGPASLGGGPGGPVQLTGPFECLQRSSYLPSGTCHQIFFNCCEYSLHFRQEHSKRRKPGLRCQVCERQLDGMASATDTAHTCSLCQQSFESAEALAEHTRAVHARPKPYQCQVCLKSFTQQGGLQQHMRMHTGDRPFPCAVCGKAFTQKAGLDQHLRIHTKLKPFRCVVCDKSFSQSVHLKQHMRTHTNIQPFHCDTCGRRFKQSSHLNFHLKSHQVGGELVMLQGGAGAASEGAGVEAQYALEEPDSETILA